MPYSAVHAKYKRMLQLHELSVDAITDIRMVVDINSNVGVTVERIFSCYASALDGAPLRAFDPAKFVLRVQDATDGWGLDLLDRIQGLNSSRRIREYAAASRPLFVEIVQARSRIPHWQRCWFRFCG